MTTTKNTTTDTSFGSSKPVDTTLDSSKPTVDLGDEKLKADPKQSAPEKEEKGEDKEEVDSSQQLPNIQMNAAGFYDADHAAPGAYNYPPSFGPMKDPADQSWKGPATLKKEEEDKKKKDK